MKERVIKQIFFWCIVVALTTSCASITKLFPKVPRPFQKRAFDSEQWKKGDYQTRGEMLGGEVFEKIYQIKSNSPEQILQIFGEPDKKTKAACCYSGRGGSSGEDADLWLYYVETGYESLDKPLRKEALKIYFDGTSLHCLVGDRDGDHSYFPVVGYLKEKR